MTEKGLIYQFDDVRVEPDQLRVSKAGRAVALEPKAFEVLLFLLEHRGQLVEKNELLDAVWSEAFVTQNACTRVIAQLRRGLGDDAREARYIETVPTRGYRFIAEVESHLSTSGNGHAKADAPATPPAAQTALASRGRSRRRAAWIAGGVLVLALVAALYYRQGGRRGGAVTEASDAATIEKATQLTSSTRLDLDATFSPDGNSIAYCSDRSGRFEVYVKPLVPGGREIRVTADGGDNIQPSWSPDGQRIAYHSRDRGGIWTVPALGGVARPLTGFGANPAWSRDGASIVFQSDGGIDIGQAGLTAIPPSTLWTVPAQGGAPRRVTRQGEPSGGHGAPTWSADGRRIFFVATDIMYAEIWSVAADGSDLRLVIKGQGIIYEPVASPDGRYLYFSSGSGNFWIRRVRLDADGGAVGEVPWLLNTGAVLARQLSFAPDGTRIVYSALTMTNNIGTVDPRTAAATSEPRLLTQDTNYRKTVQMFSPDGRRIAYAVWRMGADGEIWVMDADGSNPQQVTTEPAGLLGWTPDGGRLLMFEKRDAGQRLVQIEVGTGVRTQLPDAVRLVGGSRLSPDGNRLAFNSREGGTINVWTFDLARHELRQLTFDKEMMGFPCWSPDSRLLAIEIKRGADTHIGVMPGEGGPVEQLTSEPGQSWPGSWSPDGQEITFAGQRRGIWNIYRVSRRDRTIKQLTDYRVSGVYVRYPAWSPRGDQIVYEYAETRGNVWMMTLK